MSQTTVVSSAASLLLKASGNKEHNNDAVSTIVESEKTAMEAISQGVPLPGIPTFTEIDKQRRWMLEHMAGAFRIFARKGYTEGMSGHISLRDPEHPDCFWTNPYDMPIRLFS